MFAGPHAEGDRIGIFVTRARVINMESFEHELIKSHAEYLPLVGQPGNVSAVCRAELLCPPGPCSHCRGGGSTSQPELRQSAKRGWA